VQGAVRAVLVVEGLELAERVEQVGRFRIRVRSRSSCLQVCTQRSVIEFMRGTRMPVVTISMPSAAKTASNARVYLLSRSRIRCVTLTPAS
jgi:hypothetical protein